MHRRSKRSPCSRTPGIAGDSFPCQSGSGGISRFSLISIEVAKAASFDAALAFTDTKAYRFFTSPFTFGSKHIKLAVDVLCRTDDAEICIHNFSMTNIASYPQTSHCGMRSTLRACLGKIPRSQCIKRGRDISVAGTARSSNRCRIIPRWSKCGVTVLEVAVAVCVGTFECTLSI